MLKRKALMESISSNLHSYIKKIGNNLSVPNKKFLRDSLVWLPSGWIAPRLNVIRFLDTGLFELVIAQEIATYIENIAKFSTFCNLLTLKSLWSQHFCEIGR